MVSIVRKCFEFSFILCSAPNSSCNTKLPSFISRASMQYMQSTILSWQIRLSTLVLYHNGYMCRQTLYTVWWGHDPLSSAPPPLKKKSSATALLTLGKFAIFDRSCRLTWKRYEIRSRLLLLWINNRIDPCWFQWPWVTLKDGMLGVCL